MSGTYCSSVVVWLVHALFDLHCIDWTTIVCCVNPLKKLSQLNVRTIWTSGHVVYCDNKLKVLDEESERECAREWANDCLKRKLLLFKWSIPFCHLHRFHHKHHETNSLWPCCFRFKCRKSQNKRKFFFRCLIFFPLGLPIFNAVHHLRAKQIELSAQQPVRWKGIYVYLWCLQSSDFPAASVSLLCTLLQACN